MVCPHPHHLEEAMASQGCILEILLRMIVSADMIYMVPRRLHVAVLGFGERPHAV